MRLRYNDCDINIGEEQIQADFQQNLIRKNWKIVLREDTLCMRWEDKQEECFDVASIEEIQFTMSSEPGQGEEKASAYALLKLKNETYPIDFFYLTITEKYSLANNSKAYQFCESVVNHIAKKYSIPVKYKLAIERKGQWKGVILAFVIMAISMFVIWLRFKFSK